MKGKRIQPEPEYELGISNDERKALMEFISTHVSDNNKQGDQQKVINFYEMLMTL